MLWGDLIAERVPLEPSAATQEPTLAVRSGRLVVRPWGNPIHPRYTSASDIQAWPTARSWSAMIVLAAAK